MIAKKVAQKLLGGDINKDMGKAFSNSMLAQGRPSGETKFHIGDICEIHNREYGGEYAKVEGFDKNMFGAPLVTVKTSQDGINFSDQTTVFYPHELSVVGKAI